MGRGLAGLVLLALAGCGGGSSAPRDPLAGQLAPCPRIAILAPGADLTRYRPGAPQDLTGMTTDARIAGFDAVCDYAGRDRQALEVRITPRFEAERGPAAEGRAVDLPWFVALTDVGDRNLLARESYATRITFPANAPRASASGPTARLTLPLGEGRRASDYLVRISFQLTPQELELNRRRGPR